VSGPDGPDPFGRRAFFSQAPIDGVQVGPPSSQGDAPPARDASTEGKRALFSVPEPGEAPETPGPSRRPERTDRRRSLEPSEPTEPPSGPGARSAGAGSGGVRAGRALVECRTCLERTNISLASLAVKLIPSVWVPTRPWSHLMLCPSCGRLSWCRVKWRGGLGRERAQDLGRGALRGVDQ